MFGGDLYAGLSGIDLSGRVFDLGEGVLIRSTYAHVFAPFMVAFSPPATPSRHHPGPWKPASGGVSYDVTAELVVPVATELEYGSLLRTASILLFLLRLGINPAITLPVLSNCPFSASSTRTGGDVKLVAFEVESRRFPLGVHGGRADNDALSWVKDRWQITSRLTRECPEFALAIEALDKGQVLQNTALTMVSLWAALEALFAPNPTELRFRVSAFIASYLEGPGDRRRERQKEIALLYDKRSAAAHGRPNHDQEDLLDTFNLMREVLISIIDAGAVPKASDLERMLFGSASGG